MNKSVRWIAGAVLTATAGCAADVDIEQRAEGIAIAGAWRMPPEVHAAGQRQYVPYVGAGPWPSCSPSGTLSEATRALGDYLRRIFAGVSSYGGYSCRPNTANTSQTSVHGTGRAIDVFIPTIGGQADNSKGDPVANWLVQNAQRLGVQYIVWDRSEWGAHRSGDKFGSYGGPHPHHDHIHVELNPSATPVRACDAHCEAGDVLVGSDCGRGDCNVFGARCVDDALGARCVFGTCPARGTASICVDERRIAQCNNGAATIGDCGAFAAYCSTAGRASTEARCVSAFCVPNPRETPVAHEACWIEGGQRLHCDRNGAATTEACPAGQACSMIGGAHCEARRCPLRGESEICVDDRYIAQCINGAIGRATDCASTNSLCSTAGAGAPRCVSRACVANAGEVPQAHAVCLPDGRRAQCTSAGSLRDVQRCPAGETCVVDGDATRCVAGTSDGGSPSDDPVGHDDEDPATPESDAGAPTDAAATADAATMTESDAGRLPAMMTAGCRAQPWAKSSSRSSSAAIAAVAIAAGAVIARRSSRRRVR